MTQRHGSALLWAAALWVALLAGIVVAWSPRYWAVSVAITSISTAAVCWNVSSLLSPAQPATASLRQILQTALVVLIGAWGFLQVAFKTTVSPRLTLDAAIVWALSAAAFLLGAQILQDRPARRLFLDLILWSFTALAMIAMLQSHGAAVRVFGIFPAPGTVQGTFLSRNQFAAMMEFAAPVALAYMSGRNPVAGGLCYAMILAATITAASRAGVLLVGGELLVFLCLVLFTRRREAKAILATVAGLALLVAIASTIAGTDQIRARFDDKDPYTLRQQIFASTRQLIRERPWTGYGMGTWRSVYPRVATFDVGLLVNEAHNDWAQWASDGGLPFALLMLALVASIARPAIQSIWGLGILSVMVHSWVDYPIREPALSFLWFALAGGLSQFRGAGSEIKRSEFRK